MNVRIGNMTVITQTVLTHQETINVNVIPVIEENVLVVEVRGCIFSVQKMLYYFNVIRF